MTATKTIPAFTHHIHFANMPISKGKWCKVYATIKWDGSSLSITGVEGPKASGDCIGSCGQIVGNFHDYESDNDIDIQKFNDIWNEWHLNDMVAGSPRQEAFIKDVMASGVRYHYDVICNMLKGANLLEDTEYLHNGEAYRYGTAWLQKEVPTDVVEWLFNLPTSDTLPNNWK